MTESEWPASNDPQAMLRHLTHEPEGRLSVNGGRLHAHREKPLITARKLRLFACAAARAAGVGGWSGEATEALTLAERFADGNASPSELAAAHQQIHPALAAEFLLRPDAYDAAQGVVRHLFPGPHADARGEADSAEISAILRDLVGNPFRPVTVGNSCGYPGCDDHRPLWLTPTALSLAQAAYDDRLADGTLDPERLAVLSDALEEAGCDNDDLLRHLRGQEWCWSCGPKPSSAWQTCDVCNPGRLDWDRASGWVALRGPHVRGCWALDLILGKE